MDDVPRGYVEIAPITWDIQSIIPFGGNTYSPTTIVRDRNISRITIEPLHYGTLGVADESPHLSSTWARVYNGSTADIFTISYYMPYYNVLKNFLLANPDYFYNLSLEGYPGIYYNEEKEWQDLTIFYDINVPTTGREVNSWTAGTGTSHVKEVDFLGLTDGFVGAVFHDDYNTGLPNVNFETDIIVEGIDRFDNILRGYITFDSAKATDEST